MKNNTVRVALCQINPIVGDLNGNADKIIKIITTHTADIFLFSELVVTGYPPRDLLLLPWFMEQTNAAIKRITREVKKDQIVLIGAPFQKEDGNGLYNSAYVLSDGAIMKVIHKTLLPFYGVFDEPRYFGAPLFATKADNWIFSLNGLQIACTICEDMWSEDIKTAALYSLPAPLEVIANNSKVDLVLNLSASPWYIGKWHERRVVVEKVSKKFSCPFVYVNQVGANDDLIFDGRSLVVFPDGKKILLNAFQEEVKIVELDLLKASSDIDQTEDIPQEEELFYALTMAIQDYVYKLQFSKVIIGVSGGIDSAVVATLLTEALGKDNVVGAMLYTRYTSKESLEDAKELSQVLGIEYREFDVDPIAANMAESLGIDLRAGTVRNELDQGAWENTQSRIRGVFLMGLANRERRLLVAANNKSELAQGYSTLYGDLAGAFNPIGDILKRDVYRLARWLQKNKKKIPERILQKEPTLELREDQKDTDTLLPYLKLDLLLEEMLIESKYSKNHTSKRAIVEEKILESEYKRRQAPLSFKASKVTFGRDRQMPIVHRFRHYITPSK